MSRVITNTNILVDDFDFCKSYPPQTFIHFLTHFHSDHYEGLSPCWNYGPIYCSTLTKKFILNRFPKIANIHACQFNTKYTLQLKPGLPINFYLFDAKHIPGSAMLLFHGYMGTILFTGDFRYNFDMVKQNPILFPPSLRQNINKQDLVENMKNISIPIDQMVFDNTYCHQNFKFQTQNQIVKMMAAIIQKNQNKKIIYIAMGALGKHKILQQLSTKFQTSIVVSQKQLQKIQIAGLSTNFITTNPNQGYIQLISKKNRALIIQQTKNSPIGNNFICIDTDFLMLQHQSPDKINYIVPYSLHSNYQQMQIFIKIINPCILRKLVIPFTTFKKNKINIKIDHRLKFGKYLDFIYGPLYRSQSGYAHLVRQYTTIYNLSNLFLKWFHPHQQNNLQYRLAVGEQNHKLRKRTINLQQYQQNSKNKNKKQSIKSIANTLNASHKNISIEDSFSFVNQTNYQHCYSQIFCKKQDSQSISLTFQTCSQLRQLSLPRKNAN